MIVEAAKKYSEAGLSVIPVRKDKRPACSWKKFQTSRVMPEEVAKLFEGKEAIGVLCGEISNGMEVVDVDVKADPTGRLVEQLLIDSLSCA